ESLQRDPRGGPAPRGRGRGVGDRGHHPAGRRCRRHQGGVHRACVSHGPDPREARVGRGMTTVRDQTVGDYLQALASTAAVPGGGSAAALGAAMGAALVSMVAKLSAKKAKANEDRDVLEGLVPQFDKLAARLLELSQDDIDAYRAVIEARKSGAKGEALARAYERAAEVPLRAATAAARSLALVPEVSKRAGEMTASDLAVGSELLETGFAGALGNVAINLPELGGDAAARIERAYLELRAKAQ